MNVTLISNRPWEAACRQCNLIIHSVLAHGTPGQSLLIVLYDYLVSTVQTCVLALTGSLTFSWHLQPPVDIKITQRGARKNQGNPYSGTLLRFMVFSTSTVKKTTVESARVTSNSFKVRASVLKITLRKGT